MSHVRECRVVQRQARRGWHAIEVLFGPCGACCCHRRHFPPQTMCHLPRPTIVVNSLRNRQNRPTRRTRTCSRGFRGFFSPGVRKRDGETLAGGSAAACRAWRSSCRPRARPGACLPVLSPLVPERRGNLPSTLLACTARLTRCRTHRYNVHEETYTQAATMVCSAQMHVGWRSLGRRGGKLSSQQQRVVVHGVVGHMGRAVVVAGDRGPELRGWAWHRQKIVADTRVLRRQMGGGRAQPQE